MEMTMNSRGPLVEVSVAAFEGLDVELYGKGTVIIRMTNVLGCVGGLQKR